MSLAERELMVRAVKWVDEVVTDAPCKSSSSSLPSFLTFPSFLPHTPFQILLRWNPWKSTTAILSATAMTSPPT